MTMTAFMVAGAALSAVSQIKQGQAQKAMFNAQAQQTRIQGRSQALQARQQALQHKEDALAVMEKVRRNLATINARGAAGSLDPFSGSTGNLMTVNLANAADDYYAAMDNAQISYENEKILRGSANYQAQIYKAAGKQAMQQAMMGALTSTAMAGYQGYKGGMFGTPSPAPASSVSAYTGPTGTYGMNFSQSFGAMYPAYPRYTVGT